MEENLNLRSGLQRLRESTLERLRDIARRADRAEADKLTGEIRVLDKAIEEAHINAGELRYAPNKSAVIAILACLDEKNRPMSQDELIANLLQGGFRGGGKKIATVLKQSISSYTSGHGRKTKQIKIVNGLIGRGEWPESRFTS